MWENDSKQLAIQICRTTAWDSESNWFSFNRVWHNPEMRTAFCELFLSFWEQEINISDCLLLCPEGLVSTFGIVPFVSILANDLRLPLAIWEENGDALTASPLMFPGTPSLTAGMPCVVLQDVVGKGTTLRKLYNELHGLQWHICRYIALVQIDRMENELSESIAYCRNNDSYLTEDFRFVSMLHDKEIRGK